MEAVQFPSLEQLIVPIVTAIIALALLWLIDRALRRPQPVVAFMGGEPLDEEPGWTLPFAGVRTVLRPLVVPERVPSPTIDQRVQQRREQLTTLRQALERRYYLAVVVIGVISVLLLATQ